MEQTYHPVTMKTIYVENPEDIQYLSFFVKGSEYKLWGLFRCDRHLFGVKGSEQPVTLFGADSMGRDILSRICYGARISCSIGLVGVFLSFILGVLIGGLSGYIGGKLDSFIQRVIDFIVCLPTLPIWMALSAAIPSDWSVTKTYFCMVLILSLMGWPGLARVVRSKFISLGNEDFIRAARVAGAGTGRIIFRHMVPSFASYLIAQITLSIPGMIPWGDLDVLPRSGAAFPGGQLGHIAQRRAEYTQCGPVSLDADSRRLRGADGDGLQLRGRRPARCSGSLIRNQKQRMVAAWKRKRDNPIRPTPII